MSRANPRTTHNNAGIAAWRFKLAAPFDAERPSYESLSEFLGAARSRDIGPKMVARRALADEYIEIVLYATPIVRFYSDGTFSVDNGGFATPTTRERLLAVVPDGFRPYHEAKLLGLYGPATADGPPLYPLDHSKRITPR